MELGPRDARVLLWAEDRRLYVMWQSAAPWDAIRRSLKETFPRHSQLSYDAGRYRWSMPLTLRDALERWASWTFAPGVVEWADEDPGSFSRCVRPSTGDHSTALLREGVARRAS
jgi:hypothetical protein